MKAKGVKISSLGSGISQELDLIGIQAARDHINWVWNITSTFTDNSSIYGATIYDSRYGDNKQGMSVNKLNLYSGSGTVGSNSILTLTGPISSITKHHSETPIDPYILLSA